MAAFASGASACLSQPPRCVAGILCPKRAPLSQIGVHKSCRSRCRSELGSSGVAARTGIATRNNGSLSMAAGKNNAVAPRCSDSEETDNLSISKRDLQSSGKRGRPVRLTRQCKLEELDLELKEEVADTDVADIQLLSQSVQADFRVFGVVSTVVPRTCDRCLKSYRAHSQGRFEVWLSNTGVESVKGLSDEEMNNLEAIEDFSGSEAKVDLVPHVRDAVILSLPSKSLCDVDCAGIAAKSNKSGSVKYGVVADEEASKQSQSQTLDSKLSGSMSEKLLGLKKKLEQ